MSQTSIRLNKIKEIQALFDVAAAGFRNDQPRDEKGRWSGHEGASKSKRDQGKQLLEDIIDYSIKNRGVPENRDMVSVIDEHPDVYNMLYYAKDNIKEFLRKPEKGEVKWKWENPFPRYGPKATVFGDMHNSGFVADAWKGKAVITQMSPKKFLELASELNVQDGDDSSKKIDKIASKQ